MPIGSAIKIVKNSKEIIPASAVIIPDLSACLEGRFRKKPQSILLNPLENISNSKITRMANANSVNVNATYLYTWSVILALLWLYFLLIHIYFGIWS